MKCEVARACRGQRIATAGDVPPSGTVARSSLPGWPAAGGTTPISQKVSTLRFNLIMVARFDDGASVVKQAPRNSCGGCAAPTGGAGRGAGRFPFGGRHFRTAKGHVGGTRFAL